MQRLALILVSALITITISKAADNRFGARSVHSGTAKGEAALVGPIGTPRISAGVPYYIDNFNGANDTTSLKNRGYKIYYRGTGPQGTAPIWFQGNPAVFSSFNGPDTGYVGSNFQSVTSANTIDNWLVLPALTVVAGDSLIFYERSPTNNSFPDSIAVMFSAIGDSVPEAASWQMLGYFRTTENGTWGRRGFRAPSVASGFNARWAIRYLVYDGGPIGTNSNYIGIDALTVEGPAAQSDIAAAANISPSGSIADNVAATVQAQFSNVGTLGQSNIPVSYSITPGGYSSTRTIASLASGNSTTVTFDPFTPATTGVHSYTIIASHGTDQNRTNDTLRGTFTVFSHFGGGGGTSGGYYFANSLATNAPSYPTYGWVDPIAGGHTAITTWTSGGSGDDDFFGSTPLGFSFPFFGTNFTEVFIGSNGYLTFGTGATTTATTSAIPEAAAPNNWIAACAMDLDVSQTLFPNARVYYFSSPSQFIATYYRVHRWTGTANTDSITFQIILYPNGNIKMQYNDALTNNPPPPLILSDALVGIENAAGTAGIQYRNNGSGPPMFSSPLAIEYGTNPNNLPVQLASFTATPLNQTSVRLHWVTISEINNYGFYVQRRTGTTSTFVEIAGSFVAGHGTTNERHAYQFVDNTLPGSGTYQYRLRQVDLDGTVHHTEPITVTTGVTAVEESAPRVFSLSQNYPNPFNPTTEIRFSVENTARTKLEVFNMLGQPVMTLFDDIAESGRSYRAEVNAAELPSGVYFYRLTSGLRSQLKRMLLLK
jgi:hypothetical protein